MVALKLARWGGVGLVALLIAVAALTGAQSNRDLVATVGKPAELPTANLSRSSPDQSPSIILSVVSYVPPRIGSVMAVLQLRNAKTGTSKEIGRFGIHPDAPFTAATPDAAQRFGFPVTADDLVLMKDPDTRLTVSLEPFGGKGDNARLALGGVELK